MEKCTHINRVTLALTCGLMLPLSTSALDPAKSVFQFNVHNWGRQDGLPGNKVNSITQTADGYLWIGTQNGLVRFDGSEFTPVPVKLPDVNSQDIVSVAAAKDRGLWFALNAGGFGYHDGDGFSNIGDDRWSRADTNAPVLLVARDGAVWTGTNRSLGRWRPEHPASAIFDQSMTRVVCLHEDSQKRIWIGTQERGVFCWSDGQFTRFPDTGLATHVIKGLATGPTGELWVALEHELRRYDAGGQPMPLPEYSHPLTALLVDRHGVTWIGSASGLVRFQDGQFTTLRKADGLANEYVTALFEDREGSLWVGTQGGLSQISDLKFPIYSEKEGLHHGGSLTVTAAAGGGIWITTTGGFAHFDGRTFQNYTEPALLPNPYVKLGMEARNGDFYWVDGDKTISVLRGGKLFGRYPSPEWTEALTEDDESVLAGVGASLMRLKDGRFEPYVYKGDRKPDFQWFDNLTTARDGAIWVACYNGVFRVKDGEFRQWSADDGLSGNRVHFVYEDEDGSVWAGLSTGMARIRGDQLRNITAANGLFDNRTYAIVPDQHGFFWVNSGRGIYRVSRRALNDFADGKAPRVTCEPFDGEESVKFTDRVDQEYSGCRSVDGRIWLPNPWGVVMIDPDHFVRNRVPPPVLLQKVLVNGTEHDPATPPLLRAGDDRIEFVFTALSYISPKRVQLRYRLDGFDPDWVDARGHRSAQYNLKPGRYTFRLQAANADGIWNTNGDSITLELPPPFYATTWFYGLCGVGLVLGFAGTYAWGVRKLKLRQRKLQAENDALERRVSERTAELAYERDLLRTLLDYSPDRIYFKDAQSRVVKCCRAFAENVGHANPDELVGKSDFELFAPEHAQTAREDEQRIIQTGQPLVGKVERETRRDGSVTWALTTKMPWRDRDGKVIGTFGITKDITALKLSEAKLVEVHKQLLETSRQAGMAEVAIGVLHNVGNVLNSVNVSATLVVDRLRASKAGSIPKISAMLDEHAADLGTFVSTDPRAHKIPGYLSTLSRQILAEQSEMAEELSHLRKNIEHIRDIVALQQSLATVAGVSEAVPVSEIVEDALRINTGAIERHQVALVRDYAANPTITVERHKVLQILINLIRNAQYACADSGRSDKQMTIRITESAGHVQVSVQDNGIGIAPENLTRVFAHGFTTRKDGHGFGLHSGALAARELGGSLTATSEGVGRGALFVLDLPVQPARPIHGHDHHARN